MRLQYQLSNGAWIDCEDRTDEFLSYCIDTPQLIADPDRPGHKKTGTMTRTEIIDALKSGITLRNSPTDWYSNCRCGDAHDKQRAEKKAKSAPVEMVKCSCGCTIPRQAVMNASLGTSCPDCYDKMSAI